jgi:hypothetical protein
MVAVTVLALAMGLARSLWSWWDARPVAARTLGLLRPGMTRLEVETIIGRPIQVTPHQFRRGPQDPYGYSTITASWSWYWLELEFDADERLLRYHEECF